MNQRNEFTPMLIKILIPFPCNHILGSYQERSVITESKNSSTARRARHVLDDHTTTPLSWLPVATMNCFPPSPSAKIFGLHFYRMRRNQLVEYNQISIPSEPSVIRTEHETRDLCPTRNVNWSQPPPRDRIAPTLAPLSVADENSKCEPSRIHLIVRNSQWKCHKSEQSIREASHKALLRTVFQGLGNLLLNFPVRSAPDHNFSIISLSLSNP